MSILARPFHPARLPVPCPVIQPVQRLLDLRQRQLVFPASKISALEALQPVAANLEQVFDEDAVFAGFLDRAFLETNMGKGPTINVVNWPDPILVIRAARAQFVQNLNFRESVLACLEFEHKRSFFLPVAPDFSPAKWGVKFKNDSMLNRFS
jgi:hypothetical protein